MKSLSIFILSSFLLIAAGCSTPENNSSQDQSLTDVSESNKGQAFVDNSGSDPNVLEVAMSNDDFSTLVAAVQAAEVENALVNAGPLTVFAPNNTAFAKLPEGTVENLVKPENKATLANILTNHVAPANYTIATLKKVASRGQKLFMASGQYVEVKVDGEDVYVGGTKILATVNVSNGIIYVIEDVILP